MKSPFAVEKLKGRWVLDARGFPTVEVEAHSNGMIGTAMAPSGVSKGRFEAHDLRDGEKPFLGMGVQSPLKSIHTVLARELKDANACAQNEVDKLILDADGTPQKTKLGGNATIAASLAVARLGALLQEKPLYEHLRTLKDGSTKPFSLPMPLFTLFTGGSHAKGNVLPFQEILLEPLKARSMAHAIQMGSEIYHTVRDSASKQFDSQSLNAGDSGGMALATADIEVAFNLILASVKELGYDKQIRLGINVAASHFRKKGMYHLTGKTMTHRQLVNFYSNLLESYPISLLIDPFAEDDIPGFQGAMTRFGHKHAIVGDDLLVSNPTRIKRVLDLKACNGLDLKPNQVGTLSESLESFMLAQTAKWTTIISDRAGDTEDTFIADLAVGWESNYIKCGGLMRGERTSKYNRLLRIEEELGKKAEFGGKK
ncbi:MAG: phosphopyruvate hydratase [archaeon]|nr:phosphopyruvate hydratase [archaeon]